MNCSSLELFKVREDAYYALKYMKRTIKSYEKKENKYYIENINLNKAIHQENIFINNQEILNNKKEIIILNIIKINIKKNIQSIYHKKSELLEDKLTHYNLQLEQLNLELDENDNNLRKIHRIIESSVNKVPELKNTMIDYELEYKKAWLELKKHNEIYEYECIKQLIYKFIINNNNKIQILFELENWKNEFIKFSNSKYAIEDPNFKKTVPIISTNTTSSIYSSESELT
uniref:Uncharacterized protein n=1 Tax=viral metagenome TaxID=1070528 RepID=A0A6C0H868_9ZZZZ